MISTSASSATATHDSKRGDDASARIAVLSELPEEWSRAVERWRALAASAKKDVDDRPDGVHGPAEVVTASHVFRHARPRKPLAEQVIYELHIGTFTEEGTFRAALRRLPALAELGVTTLELMPIAAFAGERGWGYDGVALYAPHASYGTPDELRELVDGAHGLGLMVLLDVVYNHFGPAGSYLAAFSPRYFSEELHNTWGKAPSFVEPTLLLRRLSTSGSGHRRRDQPGLAVRRSAEPHRRAKPRQLGRRLTRGVAGVLHPKSRPGGQPRPRGPLACRRSLSGRLHCYCCSCR